VAISERDYSETKHLFDELRNQGITDFKRYFQENPDIVYTCFNTSKLIGFNRALMSIHGAKNRETIISLAVKSIKEKTEFWRVFCDIFTNLAEGRKFFTAEQLIITAQGQYKYIHMIVTVAPGDEDTLSRVYTCFFDITELKESEGRYKALVDLGSEVGEGILMIKDINGREGAITFASDQFAYISGYSLDELMGKSFFDLMNPKDREASLSRHRRKMKGESLPGLYELNITRKDGTEIPVELTSAVTKNKNMLANIVYLRDITQRKQMENQICMERDRARSYLDIVNVMIVTLDPDQRVSLINQKGCKILGYSQKEIIGKKWSEFFVPEEYKNKVNSLFGKLMKGEVKPVEYFENPVITKSGKTRTIAWHNSIITDAENNITGVIGSGEDITELKQAAVRLQDYKTHLEELVEERTSKLASTNKELINEIEFRKTTEARLVSSQQKLDAQFQQRVGFTRALVHELKTYLTPLVAASELLEQQNTHENLKPLSDTISSTVVGLEHRVDELLDLARGEIGRLEIHCTLMQPSEVLKKVVCYASNIAKMNDQGFEYTIPSGLPLVWADEERIIQILLNLLNNAFKYTPKGGEIRLRSWAETNRLFIEVADNGPGLKPEMLEKVFESYHIKQNERRVSSLGIGLPLARMLAKLHQGGIKVESQDGRGSIFTLFLPLNSLNRRK
jgi:PAS domain S-box-containing protein